MPRFSTEKNMSKFSPYIATVSGAAILALAVSAQAFSGHGGGHRHGSPALAACMAATPKAARENLRTMFEGSSLRADHEAVQTAKNSLAQQILAKNQSLGGYETALSQAQLKVIHDEDALAQNVCGQLTSTQLAAASTLYTNLQNNHQTVRAYFEAAHQASGDPGSSASGQSDSPSVSE
jgi:hypothetical protein